MTNPDNVGGLPELPETIWLDSLAGRLYTADQMRAYGELCRAAPAGGDDQIGWLNVSSKKFFTLAELADTPRNQRLIEAGVIVRLYSDAGPDPWVNCRPVDSAPAGGGVEYSDRVADLIGGSGTPVVCEDGDANCTLWDILANAFGDDDIGNAREWVRETVYHAMQAKEAK